MPTRGAWLGQNLPSGSDVGVDPFLMTKDEYDGLAAKLKSEGVGLVPVAENLVDHIWSGQPDYPENEVKPLEMDFCGKSWQDKVDDARKAMAAKGADCLVLSALDDVAWMLNLRKGAKIRGG